MICALLLGRKGSVGFPGKNVHKVLGREMSRYPMLAAQHAKSVNRTYLSTDDEELMALAERHKVEVIRRPDYLCTPQALGEDAYLHGYREILARNPGVAIELMVLLFCNAATLLAQQIEEGIAVLRSRPDLDSAVTAGRMNWYSPARARRRNPEGLLVPFIPFEVFETQRKINCDRDSQGDCFFADVCVSVVRPRNLERMEEGLLPQRWMGRRIHPISNVGGLDIDEAWQLPLVEGYLLRSGFSETRTPYDKG